MNTNFKLKIILITIAALGFTLSSYSGWLLYKVEEDSIITEFQRDVDERVSSLHRELLINFETLQSLAILFNGTAIPGHEQFRNEAQRILSRHGDIQALEWIPRIVQSERAQYVSRIRRDFPNYEISERQQQGVMVRAGERQEYFPVYFVEPLLGNESALGFDLASSPSRLEALEKSRDRDIPQATASITLVQESEKQKGFLAFLPIYRGRPLTIGQRRENLVGFVLGVYRIGDIFTSSALSKKSLGIEMKLIDETLLAEHEMLYSHKSRTGFPSHENISYRKDLPEIWGRKWSLIASPTINYVAHRQSIAPQVVFFIGIVFTAFIVLYFKMMSQRTFTIQQKVTEKTIELREVNEKLEFLSRSDGLTGIANRRLMDEVLDKEWLRAIRNKTNISFLLIDVDYFKTYNDNYGHLKGDACLTRIATTLENIPGRPTDLVARYGGEEFAIVLTETESAQTVAENCRRAVEELQIQHEFSETAEVVTISIGVCTGVPRSETNPCMIIDSADKALYKAKKTGRNKIETNVLAQEIHLAFAGTEKLTPSG